jgi:CubicO group peptidase (beta-lactamase class C family)
MSLPEPSAFPGEDWLELTPEQAGLDPDGFAEFLAGRPGRPASFGGEDPSGGRYGAVLARGGYLVHVWGDRHYRFQTASVGKALVRALVGLAAADGLLDPDEPVNRSWTGAGELSHPHKHLDRGHHETLTWRHLLGERRGLVHHGGFPIELGIRWREGRVGLEEADAVPGIPEWASWTGDPFFDCYSHAEPGTVALYSSAGFWRLGQALTAVWRRDLKDVVDERLFRRIGIPAERWGWLTGGFVKDRRDFYPAIPDSYTYLDPPYEVAGHAVRSGPGWVVISASDLARFGHLVATAGVWEGEQLLDPEWLRGHGGGNRSGVNGEGRHLSVVAAVTTELGPMDADGLIFPRWCNSADESFLPEELFVGPVTPPS